MNPKQRRFVAEYLKDQNGTQAAIRAGYSKKTAQEQASQLLSKLIVREAVDAGLKRVEEDAGLTAKYVLDGLRTVADRCMQGVEVLDREGNVTGEWEFDSSGANRALELLGKHLGIFDEGRSDERDSLATILQSVNRELASRQGTAGAVAS